MTLQESISKIEIPIKPVQGTYSEKMFLSNAINRNSSLLLEVLNNYQQEVNYVNTFMLRVYSFDLPKLHFPIPPEDAKAFQDCFVNMELVTSKWTKDVFLQLVFVPNNIKSKSDPVSNKLNRAKDLAIKKDLDNLKDVLDSLKETFTTVKDLILETKEKVADFQTTQLDTVKTNLDNVVTQTIKDEELNQTEIDKLQSDINAIQDEINSLNKDLIGYAIGLGGSVLLGVITLPLGPVAWLFFGGAIAALSYAVDLTKKKIKDAENKIAGDEALKDQRKNDMVQLKQYEKSFQDLADEIKILKSSMETVFGAWDVLSDNVITALEDLNKAINATSTPDYELIVQDLDNTIKEWNNITSNAKDVTLDMKFSNAKIEVGMSPDEVEAAIAKSDVVNIVDFYTKPQIRKNMLESVFRG